MKWFRFVFLAISLFFTLPQVPALVKPTALSTTDIDLGAENETLEGITTLPPQKHAIDDFPERVEKIIKGFIREGVKMVMSRMMTNFDQAPKISPKCLKAFMKFISDLRNTKVWALKMLDASSKLPAGIFEGTFTDYGDFDECLEISVPMRNGREDFRGRFCVIEAAPRMPPTPKNFSLSTLAKKRAKPLDTLATEARLTKQSFHFLEMRIGVCIPSSCSKEDIQNVASSVFNMSLAAFRVPKCYVKESIKFHAVHIAVLCVSTALVILAISGAVVDHFKRESESMDSAILQVLSLFSLTRNSRKLFATSKGELNALHGIRFLSMAWVILGHTYVYVSYKRVRRLSNLGMWVNNFEFEAILNGWLAVEGFFFLSGFLTCYGTLQVLEKTKGRLNYPMFVIHRYLRLTPSLLLTMGLVLFLPLMGSGPFWYERVDESVDTCWNYWWTNLLYISNWWPIDKICTTTAWYLSADFQLYLLSPLVFLILYRSALFGMMVLIALTLACNIAVGVLTYVFELPPAILISTGNTEQINREINMVHTTTFAHAGPYFVGVVTGYLILKKKNNLQFKKQWQKILGWIVSITVSVCSVYGVHRWNTGYFHGPFVTSLYAAMHRTTFTLGVAWVAIACITGIGGPVNWILSSKIWSPLGRLTYVIYLLHGPVLFIRAGTIRERFYLSHYNLMYEYFSNLVFVISLSLPFYLLVEAPFSNLQRILFGSSRSTKRNEASKNEPNPEQISVGHKTNDELTSSPVTSSEAAFPAENSRNGIPLVIKQELNAK